MRAGIAVLVSAFVFGTASVAIAQNLNDIINQLPAIAQSGIAKLAESEWKKLPPAELDCVNQKLRERGDSTQSLAQRGIFPGSPRFGPNAAPRQRQSRPTNRLRRRNMLSMA